MTIINNTMEILRITPQVDLSKVTLYLIVILYSNYTLIIMCLD